MSFKRNIFLMCVLAVIASLIGCNNARGFNVKNDITVVSREDGSGTRGAFVELIGIEELSADGKRSDKTTKEAIIANKTDVMLSNVTGDFHAIGYVSMGSLSSSVKALSVDGVQATPDNVKNGSYKISRPFNIAVKSDISKLAQDFIDFILSSEGQAVVSNGYIAIDDNTSPYGGSKPSGKIVVAGSSSVTPIMEKLKEAYLEINPNAKIEIQMSDSTAGMTGAIEGTCDIGMASRNLKDSEKQVLKGIEIALDGIAVIVNSDNPLNDISIDDVKGIFTGKKIVWSEIQP
jgi:phosphate transport system substrate-binding protein